MSPPRDAGLHDEAEKILSQPDRLTERRVTRTWPSVLAAVVLARWQDVIRDILPPYRTARQRAPRVQSPLTQFTPGA